MSMDSPLLDLAFLVLLLYPTWAVVLSDSRFHRVWSLALSLLSFLTGRLFNEPFSASRVPLAILVLFILAVCVVLSPAQLFLFHTKSISPKRKALKIFNPINENDHAVEFVSPVTQINTMLLTLPSRLVSWPFTVLQRTQKQHGCLHHPETTSSQTATRSCGSGISYQRKRV